MENPRLGAYRRNHSGAVEADVERVHGLCPRLRERLTQDGGTLSRGEQQMLAIARALMALPRLMLLDEPSMGPAPVIVEAIVRTIIDINRAGTTILLVGQNASLALQVAKRGYIFESGIGSLTGRSEELRASEDVRSDLPGRVGASGRSSASTHARQRVTASALPCMPVSAAVDAGRQR